MSRPHVDPGALEPPTPRGMLGEVRLVREVPRLLLAAPGLARARRAAPRRRASAPVLVVPGYTSSDAATAPVRWYLAQLGFDVHGWGLGTNHGDVGSLLPRVTDIVHGHHTRTGRPVHLVGWSLGGVLAREVARASPHLVEQVITYGTPVVGGPKYTVAAGSYGAQAVDQIAADVAVRNRVPIGVPVTALYSRHDRVVAWGACVDPYNPTTEHVEVFSSHAGMGIDPDVWRTVAHRLDRRS